MSRAERRAYQCEIDHLNDRLTQVLNELGQAQRELACTLTQKRKLLVQVAALTGHPRSPNGWMSGTQFIGGRPRGGDDEMSAARLS